MSTGRSTVWVLSNSDEHKLLGKALAEVVKCDAQAKKLEMRSALAKSQLKEYCYQRWTEDFALRGWQPPAPVKLVNSAGQSVTYVIQDKTGSASLGESDYSDLVAALGRKRALAATSEKRRVYFDPNVLDQESLDGRTVGEAVEEQLALLADDLVIAKSISPEQAKSLFVVAKTRAFVPGFLSRLPSFCDFSADKLRVALEMIGSAVVRYIKV